MYVGSIPDPRDVDEYGPDCDRYDESGVVLGDFWHAWTRCCWCDAYDVQFEARSARAYCSCHKRRGCHPSLGCDNFDRCHNGNDPALLRAYAAARSARFEHEERERW